MSRHLFTGKMEEAKVSGRGQYFSPGDHVVEITKTDYIQSQQGDKEYAIVETAVVESTVHPKGDSRTWLVNMGNAYSMGNVKGWAIAVLKGITLAQGGSLPLADLIDDNDEEQAQAFRDAIELLGPELTVEKCEAFGDTHAFALLSGDFFGDESPVGVRLYLRTRQIETRRKTDFTIHDWAPLDEDAFGRVATLKAQVLADKAQEQAMLAAAAAASARGPAQA